MHSFRNEPALAAEYRTRLRELDPPAAIHVVYGSLWALVPTSESAVRVGEWRATMRQALRHYAVFEALLAQQFGWSPNAAAPLPLGLVPAASPAVSTFTPPSTPSSIDRWAAPPPLAGGDAGSAAHAGGDGEYEAANVVLRDTGVQWGFVGASGLSWKANHGGAVRRLTAHPFERLLLSAGKDAVIRIWAPRGGTSCVATYKGHKEPVTHMSVVPEREWVCSCDGELQVFDLETQQKLHALRAALASGHSPSFTASLALSALNSSPTAGATVLVGSTSKYPGPVAVKVMDLRCASRALEWHLPPAVNDACALTEGQACLWVGTTTGQICQLDLRSGLVRRSWQAHQESVTGMLARPAALISGVCVCVCLCVCVCVCSSQV